MIWLCSSNLNIFFVSFIASVSWVFVCIEFYTWNEYRCEAEHRAYSMCGFLKLSVGEMVKHHLNYLHKLRATLENIPICLETVFCWWIGSLLLRIIIPCIFVKKFHLFIWKHRLWNNRNKMKIIVTTTTN